MKRQVVLLLLILFCLNGKAREKKKERDEYRNQGFALLLQSGFSILPDVTKLEDGVHYYDAGTSSSLCFSFSCIPSYFIVDGLSAGVGVGVDLYHAPNLTIAPIFLDLRYYFTDEKESTYLFANVGATLNLGSDFERADNIKLGVGYKYFVGKKKKLCMPVDLFWGFTDVSLDGKATVSSQYTYTFRNKIGVSVGLLF